MVPARHADEEPRRGQALPARAVGLELGHVEDADAVAARLEQAPDHRRAERRMVDVAVAGDEQDVERVPAARAHLGARARQEGCNRMAAHEVPGAVLTAARSARSPRSARCGCPGSVIEWPESGTTTSFASGQARCRSQAERIGQTTS